MEVRVEFKISWSDLLSEGTESSIERRSLPVTNSKVGSHRCRVRTLMSEVGELQDEITLIWALSIPALSRTC
jgi:hypothetical protein